MLDVMISGTGVGVGVEVGVRVGVGDGVAVGVGVGEALEKTPQPASVSQRNNSGANRTRCILPRYCSRRPREAITVTIEA